MREYLAADTASEPHRLWAGERSFQYVSAGKQFFSKKEGNQIPTTFKAKLF